MKILNRVVDICLYTGLGIGALTLVLLIIVKLCPGLNNLEWFFGNIMPYIFAGGFFITMVGRTIYWHIPIDIKEE